MSGNAYIDHNLKIIAFWSPKCACTSVDHWFAKGVLMLDPEFKLDLEENDKIGAPRIYLAKNGFRYKFEDALEYAKNGDYFIVHFTRHPALRLVSAFLNKFVFYHGKHLATFESLEPFAKDLVKKIYQKNAWSGWYKGIRFSDMVKYLETVIPNQPCDTYVDHHWLTQLPSSLVRGRHIKPNYVVHAERFDRELSVLNSKLGISYCPDKFNVTVFKSSELNKSDLSRVFSLDLGEINTKILPFNLLNERLLAKIGSIYQVDYRYFGYRENDLAYVPDEKVEHYATS